MPFSIYCRMIGIEPRVADDRADDTRIGNRYLEIRRRSLAERQARPIPETRPGIEIETLRNAAYEFSRRIELLILFRAHTIALTSHCHEVNNAFGRARLGGAKVVSRRGTGLN